MNIDRYTKTVLTVIAACLVWIALGGRSLLLVANAQASAQPGVSGDPSGQRVLLSGWIDDGGVVRRFPAPYFAPALRDDSQAKAQWQSQPASLPTSRQAPSAVCVTVAGELAPEQPALPPLTSPHLEQQFPLESGGDRNDPIIRAQADAYSANEQRASRDYLADIAEKSGPNTNLRGEQRLAAERVGQRTGAFEAELMGRELTARREEIAQALQLYASTLSTDQQRELQRQIAILDQAIAQQQLASGYARREQEWQTELLRNEQFNKDLGLRAEDRASYYDLLRRGLA